MLALGLQRGKDTVLPLGNSVFGEHSSYLTVTELMTVFKYIKPKWAVKAKGLKEQNSGNRCPFTEIKPCQGHYPGQRKLPFGGFL